MEKEKPLTVTQVRRMLKAKQKTWLNHENNRYFIACSTGFIDLDPKVFEKVWSELPFQWRVATVVQGCNKEGRNTWRNLHTTVTRRMAAYVPLWTKPVKGGSNG